MAAIRMWLARIGGQYSTHPQSGTASRPVNSSLTHRLERNADLESRLDRIEAQLGINEPGRQGVADD